MRLECCLIVGTWMLAMLLAVVPVSAQQVTVTSAEPSSGEQDTVSLDVRVKGKGFGAGAQAKFYIDDDAVTGGITVNETLFVSSTEVIARVSIAAGASLSFFDIKVTNSNGRTGRGSDLFQVVEKGAHADNECRRSSSGVESRPIAKATCVPAGYRAVITAISKSCPISTLGDGVGEVAQRRTVGPTAGQSRASCLS